MTTTKQNNQTQTPPLGGAESTRENMRPRKSLGLKWSFISAGNNGGATDWLQAASHSNTQSACETCWNYFSPPAVLSASSRQKTSTIIFYGGAMNVVSPPPSTFPGAWQQVARRRIMPSGGWQFCKV